MFLSVVYTFQLACLLCRGWPQLKGCDDRYASQLRNHMQPIYQLPRIGFSQLASYSYTVFEKLLFSSYIKEWMWRVGDEYWKAQEDLFACKLACTHVSSADLASYSSS